MAEGFSTAQLNALAIMPKLTAPLSIVGSGLIINDNLIMDREKTKKVYNRLLVTMSFYDIIAGCAIFLSTWPIPSSALNVSFNVGNTQTCVAQGFFIQFGIITPMVNMCLTVHYLLVIRYSWSEDQIRKRAEPWFHMIPLTIALGTDFASIGLDLFNKANLWCWIAAYPPGCTQTFQSSATNPPTCQRGDNASIYQIVFFYGIVWFVIFFVMAAMFGIYFTFRQLDKANAKYAGSQVTARTSGAKKKVSKSKMVAMQAMYYVGAFYLTFLFATLNRMVQLIWDHDSFALLLLHAIFFPLQGFWNYLIYIRPRYIKYRQQKRRERESERVQAERHQHVRSNFAQSIKAIFVDDFKADDDEEEAREEICRRKSQYGMMGVPAAPIEEDNVHHHLSTVNEEGDDGKVEVDDEVPVVEESGKVSGGKMNGSSVRFAPLP